MASVVKKVMDLKIKSLIKIGVSFFAEITLLEQNASIASD